MAEGGRLPTTIRDATFRAERLKTMRMRLSAAYKGVNALLMKEAAQDFRSGQKFDHTAFFGENVDIHHIFPKAWCAAQGIRAEVYDSIINKTPLSYRTNRIIGGAAPSDYLAKLETGNADTPPIPRANLERYLASHLINPALLLADDFQAFMADRQSRLLKLIEQATGQAVYRDKRPEEGEEAETDGELAEAELTLSAGGEGESAGFDPRERQRQGAYLAAEFPERTGFQDANYRLLPEHAGCNLAPSIRDLAPTYFASNGIAWHTHANHGLSSQVCCLNFLMPLARRPDLLARLVGSALGISDPEMLPVEPGPDSRPWFIGFEWIGGDYLNEAGSNGARKRGAHCTSADAVVRFRHTGITETLLVEWKYTERYGQPIPPDGNETRTRRYKGLAFGPSGPIRNDLKLRLEDFFWEPFYQLLRQQMLASEMQKAREQGADRVRVLHIGPAGNRALTKVTSPALQRFGDNAFQVFRSLLIRPDDFVNRSTEDLFGPYIAELAQSDPWSAYLARRYAFVFDPVVSVANG